MIRNLGQALVGLFAPAPRRAAEEYTLWAVGDDAHTAPYSATTGKPHRAPEQYVLQSLDDYDGAMLTGGRHADHS